MAFITETRFIAHQDNRPRLHANYDLQILPVLWQSPDLKESSPDNFDTLYLPKGTIIKLNDGSVKILERDYPDVLVTKVLSETTAFLEVQLSIEIDGQPAQIRVQTH